MYWVGHSSFTQTSQVRIPAWSNLYQNMSIFLLKVRRTLANGRPKVQRPTESTYWYKILNAKARPFPSRETEYVHSVGLWASNRPKSVSKRPQNHSPTASEQAPKRKKIRPQPEKLKRELWISQSARYVQFFFRHYLTTFRGGWGVKRSSRPQGMWI